MFGGSAISKFFTAFLELGQGCLQEAAQVFVRDLASSGADVWRVTLVRAPPSALVPTRPEEQPKSNF